MTIRVHNTYYAVGVTSKTSHSLYGYLNQYRLVLRWTTEVRAHSLRVPHRLLIFEFLQLRSVMSWSPVFAPRAKSGSINCANLVGKSILFCRGFLRKAKSVVSSAVSPIIIDKHELHSTWPVYCQPETRHLAQEGVNLIVERNHTCYGPGDRVSVVATVKSDSLHTVILRGFEFSLKEATVFTAGAPASGRKAAPQVRQLNIAESKVAVNATLYGGTSHTAELSLLISPEHTTTSLNAARHIDVTYTLIIRALMGTGTHLIMELPVIVSNWQRSVRFFQESYSGLNGSMILGMFRLKLLSKCRKLFTYATHTDKYFFPAASDQHLVSPFFRQPCLV